MREKETSQSSLKFWGSSFSVRHPTSGFWGAILGRQKSLSPGLKLLFYYPKACRHKGLEKDIPVPSSHLSNIITA